MRVWEKRKKQTENRKQWVRDRNGARQRTNTAVANLLFYATEITTNIIIQLHPTTTTVNATITTKATTYSTTHL